VPKLNRSWFSLLIFCLTCVLASAIVCAVILAGATLAFARGQSSLTAAERTSSLQTVSGVISDSYCGARHAADSGKSPAECTRACVGKGASYVLVNGDDVYVLRGRPSRFEQLAGQRVQVKGALKGNILRVKSIAAQ
jgi:hypothetical protein